MNPKHMTRGYRERKGTIIENSLQYRMAQATTTADKRVLVTETNPLFYVFGETRKVFKPYLSYQENYNVRD
jgi:hypothetical protein